MAMNDHGTGNGLPTLRPPGWVLGLWLLTAVGAVLIYPRLPDVVPMHWNIAGEVDRWGPKSSALYLLLLSPGIFFFMPLLARIDPKRQNYTRFGRAFEWLRGALTLFPIALFGITVAAALGTPIDISKAIGGLVSALFLVIGNRLGQLHHNYFTGIRTPWTLASEVVWRRTHRLAGWAWTAVGGIGLVLTLFAGPPAIFYAILGGTGIVVAGATIYSYLVYKKLEEKQ